jgi:hypothetical protein
MATTLLYLTVAGAVAGAMAIVLVLLIRKLVSPARCELVSTEWLSRFSVAKYRPMERLFSEEDYRYLNGRRGYHPRIARQLRRERIGVFRGYLRLLRSDYRRLEAAIGLYVADSPVDRPDLARALIQRRLQFTRAVLAAEWRLRLHGFGVSPPDTQRLVAALDDMRTHLRRQALVRQASLA